MKLLGLLEFDFRSVHFMHVMELAFFEMYVHRLHTHPRNLHYKLCILLLLFYTILILIFHLSHKFQFNSILI